MKTHSSHLSMLMVAFSVSLLMTASDGAASAKPTETKVISTDAGFGDRFGCSSAISGVHAIIGQQGDDDHGGDAGAVYVLDITTASQLRKLTASDAAGGDYFGCSVSIVGDRTIVGALRDDHVAEDAGSAYIFDVNSDSTELLKLTASDAAEDDWFGRSVGISPSYAIVGSYKWDYSASYYDAGSAYLFDASTGTELRHLIASDAGRQDWFGHGVAVSETYALVGAPTWDGPGASSCGAAYVFDAATGDELWRLTASDKVAGDRLGNAVAISGDYAVVGAYWKYHDGYSSSGAVYVFDITTGLELRKLAPSDTIAGAWFGSSVAVSGNIAVIGASHDGCGDVGAAYIFDITTGEELEKVIASDGEADEDNFGVSVGVDGTYALVGADKDKERAYLAGAAYIFEPVGISTAVDIAAPPTNRFVLQNHPNPFNPTTEICLTLPGDAAVTLGVYDISGRLLRTLLQDSHNRAGEVRVVWDGTNDAGNLMPSGAYFYKAEAGKYRAARKMILLK